MDACVVWGGRLGEDKDCESLHDDGAGRGAGRRLAW